MIPYSCNLSTQDAEAGGSPQVGGRIKLGRRPKLRSCLEEGKSLGVVRRRDAERIEWQTIDMKYGLI